MEILCIILLLLLLVAVYIIYNLVKKVEVYEERLIERNDSFNFVLETFKKLLGKMREIDNKKMFESDDEVGTTFSMLSNLIEDTQVLVETYQQEDNGSDSSR